jgi:hypothetical protein
VTMLLSPLLEQQRTSLQLTVLSVHSMLETNGSMSFLNWNRLVVWE